MAPPASSLPAVVRTALGRAVDAAFLVLGAAIVLGRVPLPGGDSFGYGSWARNLVVAALVGHLAGVPGLRLRASRIGAALLAYLVAATLSVVANRGSFADVRTLAVGVGLLFVAKALASSPGGTRRLLDWLGAVVAGIVLRELFTDPSLLFLRESARANLATDHPNTLGYAFAVLAPLFLGAASGGPGAARAAFYTTAAWLGTTLTFSRAAWIGVALGSGAVALAQRTPRRLPACLGSRASRLVLAVGSTAIVALVAIAVVHLSLERGESDQQRLRIIETSLTLFREHWPLGVGFGTRNLERLFPSRYIELFGASLFLFHSHNFYIDALAGTGVVGSAAAALLVVVLVDLARRGLRLPAEALSRPEAIACAATVAIFLLLGLADMPFYHGRLTILVAVAFAWIEVRIEDAEARVAGRRTSP